MKVDNPCDKAVAVKKGVVNLFIVLFILNETMKVDNPYEKNESL